MDLNVKPTSENIEQLKSYVEKLPSNSPYLWLVKYEQQLLNTQKTVRALARICNSDNHTLVNKLEGLSKENWFRVSNLTDISEIPDNYFDVILWSDCDIEAELRQVIEIYPKLKVGGRIYFDNLVDTFGLLIKKCLSQKDLQKLLGQKLNPTFEQSVAFGQLVQSMLKHIFTTVDKDYFVKLLHTKGTASKQYIVLTKGIVKFEPSADLVTELEKVDATLVKKFPINNVLHLTPERIEKIRNRVFEIITDSNASITSKQLCKQLVAEQILPDCKVKGPHEHFLSQQHIDTVQKGITKVADQIDKHIAMNVLSAKSIIDLLKDIPESEIADEDHWNKLISKLATDKINTIKESIEEKEPTPETINTDILSTDSEDEDSDEEVEELELYPEIPAPKEQLPAVLLPGLTNIGGFSCFMDSVLFAILLPKEGYFEKNILDKKLTTKTAKRCNYFNDKKDSLEYLQGFQAELRKLANIIRGNQEPSLTCYPIVQQMQQCNALTEALMSGNQQDDSEFLRALMQMFNLTPTTITVTRAVSNDKKEWIQTSQQLERQAILEVHMPENNNEIPELVSWYQRIQISNYQYLPLAAWHKGPTLDDPSIEQPYQYSREKITINSSDALLFHIARRQIKGWSGGNPKYIKNTQPIIFKEYIEQHPNKHFALQVVTIHSGSAYGGHYTAYFKYGSQWFHYDDTAGDVQRVRPASWEEVVNKGSSNGSLYMYFPID